jgi:hypothetical protein
MLRKFCTIALLYFGVVAFFPVVEAEAQPNSSLSNERFVIRAIVQINGAQATYQATSGNGNYGSLADLRNAGFIDAVLAASNKYGYSYVMTVTASSPGVPSTYRLTATPIRYPKTGKRSFFTDHTGETRGADKNGEVATAADPLIESCALWGLSDNERCSVQALRALNSAEMTYQATSGNGSFGSLAQLRAAALISSVLATGNAHGYIFVVTISPQTSAGFAITATPQIYRTTGIRSFFINESGVLRGADKNGSPADANDPPIEN